MDNSNFFHFLASVPGNEGHDELQDLSYQELGIAKLSGFCEWLSLHPFLAVSDDAVYSDMDLNSQKMIIFAHHHKVLDRVQVIYFLKVSVVHCMDYLLLSSLSSNYDPATLCVSCSL